MASFLICERRFDRGDPALTRAIAVAHLRHERPRCLCRPEGIEMYVAKVAHGFVLKRMPYSASRHAGSCRSHGSRRAAAPARARVGHATPSPHLDETDLEDVGQRALGLRDFVSAMWRDAELTRWRPGFEGRRSWATVRSHLLASAAIQDPEDQVIRRRLYIPEFFRVDDREAIRTRRLASWSRALESRTDEGGMFLIGELKKIVPTRQNFEIFVKHVPDQAFELPDRLYRWISQGLMDEMSLWGANADVRMVVVARFTVQVSGKPLIECLNVMPVSLQWLPVWDHAGLLRVRALVQNRDTFDVAHFHGPIGYPRESVIGADPQAKAEGRRASSPGDAAPNTPALFSHHENPQPA